MPDFSKIRSLEDIAVPRQPLQQRANHQNADLQQDAARIQRAVSHVLSRFRKVGHAFSFVTSCFTPVSIFTPKLSKGALLLSVLKRLLHRFRKRA